MHHDREAFHNGIELLFQLQRKLKYVPKRKGIKHLIKKLVHKAKLKGDPRQSYFEKLAASALLGKEPMYWNFKSKRRK